MAKDNIRKIAREFFIENYHATQEEVAELFGVTEKTLGAWLHKEKWKEARTQYHSSPVQVSKLLREELLWLSQGNKGRLNADSIRKLQLAINELDKKADPSVVYRVLIDLGNFISEMDPKLAVQCVKLHKQFLSHRINLEVKS